MFASRITLTVRIFVGSLMVRLANIIRHPQVRMMSLSEWLRTSARCMTRTAGISRKPGTIFGIGIGSHRPE
jgi:hypothetical protein